ncbi:MAG: 1-acyl-sn-glycerol-3-phosphate acyltransferase [Candidatus Margulisbacteria bacterium]|nr:1-acyl-sn-glycerol-3-phosphate acyltransferase [Candidatus Margulisiibacteriota bacterium]MBU1617624.1 1-acyl-sn-glycerol-3-phosphate acyltransferase [Candidatus Margulisiibacteriota bacterium]
MIIIRLLHNLVLFLAIFFAFFLASFITFFFVPFYRDKHYPFQVAAKYWSKMIILLSGSQLKVSGLENIPKGALMIAANHQGAADIPIVLGGLPVTFLFAIKKELFNIPIFGWYLKMAGYFPVNREMVLNAYKLVDKMVSLLKQGDRILIFPEGTRSRDGSLGNFKRGSLLAALKAEVPVLPVAISGSYNILPKGAKLFSSAKVNLSVGKPVYFTNEAEYEAKLAEVRQSIADMLKAPL